jgi:phage portal protein BeeE
MKKLIFDHGDAGLSPVAAAAIAKLRHEALQAR